MLPGIGGDSFVSSNIANGLVDGQVPGQIEVFDWTSGNALRSFEHLLDQDRIFDQSLRLSERIQRSQRDFPNRPISLVAHSGGAGVVMTALENLPDNQPVASVVLLAPAVSADYPVQNIIHKVTAGLWLFYSPLDVQLTVGTTVTGTIDGDHAPAAGGRGFNTQVPGLVQVPFRPSMAVDRNLGGHLGTTNSKFVGRQVAPIIRNAHIAACPEFFR